MGRAGGYPGAREPGRAARHPGRGNGGRRRTLQGRNRCAPLAPRELLSPGPACRGLTAGCRPRGSRAQCLPGTGTRCGRGREPGSPAFVPGGVPPAALAAGVQAPGPTSAEGQACGQDIRFLCAQARVLTSTFFPNCLVASLAGYKCLLLPVICLIRGNGAGPM